MWRAGAVALLLVPPGPVVRVSVEPGAVAITTGQCNGVELDVRLTNAGAEPVYADARLAAADVLHMPRRAISTWLPPGYTRTVPVAVSAPTGTAPGVYLVRVTGAGQRVEVPVTVSPPSPSPDLTRSVSRVNASSYRAGLLPCGALDGDADPARWWKGTGWADSTGKEWPDWLQLRWAAPQTVSRVTVTTVDSAEFPVAQFGLRDWDVQVAGPGGWQTVAAVRGNTAVTVTSDFAPRVTTEVRILTHAANGTNDWSRITEVAVS
ncbi:discoidin domain-containing protein [Actinoplanes sp. NPDC024001]|uniref:discoidin domain-containing protein n=1 Tax=Actinoplanes sp. NPDC024001 TaxID=3154598 RepID=UPI0033E4D8C7